MDRQSVADSIRTGRLHPLKEVTAAYLDRWAGRKDAIRERIWSLIREELHSTEVVGRNLVIADIILQYVLKTLEKDRALLKERGTDGFRILGLELARNWEFEGYSFFGFIDRLDSFAADEVRIVDYKTGRVEQKDVDIHSGNAEQVVSLLFGPDNAKRPKIALQLFLYDMYMAEETRGRKVINAVYPAAKLFSEDIRTAEACPEFQELMREKLKELLSEMADPARPVVRTDDRDTCKFCDFKIICGR